MPLNPDALEVAFAGCAFGVSARRIQEHMMLGQINPFGRAVSLVRSPREATELIDVIRLHGLDYSLTGMTLSGLADVALSAELLGDNADLARRGAAHKTVRDFVADVERAAKLHALRRAARNVPSTFLPAATRSDPLGVPMLRSRLRALAGGTSAPGLNPTLAEPDLGQVFKKDIAFCISHLKVEFFQKDSVKLLRVPN